MKQILTNDLKELNIKIPIEWIDHFDFEYNYKLYDKVLFNEDILKEMLFAKEHNYWRIYIPDFNTKLYNLPPSNSLGCNLIDEIKDEQLKKEIINLQTKIQTTWNNIPVNLDAFCIPSLNIYYRDIPVVFGLPDYEDDFILL